MADDRSSTNDAEKDARTGTSDKESKKKPGKQTDAPEQTPEKPEFEKIEEQQDEGPELDNG